MKRIIQLTAFLLGVAAATALPWTRPPYEFREGGSPNKPTMQDVKVVGTFHCTLYYTPMEKGFTAERGFDLTPETKPGLGGRLYARDFLRCVRMQGTGRLNQPVDGKKYIHFDGKKWGFTDAVRGSSNKVLEPHVSCAMSRRQKTIPRGATIQLLSKEILSVFGNLQWEVLDSGGGLAANQIDLYWGEDEPKGVSHRNPFLPVGTDFEHAYNVPVVVGDTAEARK